MKGRAWKYGDDINTDLIFPGRYLHIFEREEMAKHAMEDLDPKFREKVQEGDFIVAGKNFGCGSSREQAATCLRAVGIGAIIAKSYARIFYRNAINQGILPLTTSETDMIGDGDELEIEVEMGEIRDLTRGKTIRFEPLPSFIMEIIKDGGLIPHTKKRLRER